MMRMMTAGALALAAGLGADPFHLDSYTQEFEVELASPEAAAKARVEVLPLWRGKAQAFSSRWDDNALDHLRVKEVMERHGMRGTFFLTAVDGWTAPSASGVKFDGQPRDLDLRLKQGGHSIGAHSLNHAFVPYLNRNRQFHEVLGCRVEREEHSQSAVNAYAFSFMSVRNDLEGDPSQRDLAEILARAGFIHHSEHPFEATLRSDFSVGQLICGDGGRSMGLDLEQELKKPRAGSDKPLWVVSMHAWMNDWGGPQFPKLAALYGQWGGRKDWWYCNQNEYAAYRYQFSHGKVEARAEGRVLKVRVQRFEPSETGDEIPLTLRLAGVAEREVKGLRAPRCRPAVVPLADGSKGWDLPHDQGHALPQAWGLDALGLQEASLSPAEGGFRLELKAAQDLRDLRLTLRLPLKYAQGVQRRRQSVLRAGEALALDWPARPALDDAIYTDDKAYAVLQVDAWKGSTPVRAYVQCFEAAPKRDPSAPKGGFWVLGPLGADQASQALRLSEAKGRPPACAPGGKACWKEADQTLAAQLGPEIIPAGAKDNSRSFYTWDASLHHPGPDPLHYVLWGQVVSPSPRRVQARFDAKSVVALYLNGRRVSGTALVLKAGPNDLRLVYAAQPGPYASFSAAHYGPWFRLEAGPGQRDLALRYELPERAQP